MNTIAIGIMDRNDWKARTDIIIIINFVNKTLTWIPRDTFCNLINNRINMAYSVGKDILLKKCLFELKYKVKDVICILPMFIEQIFNLIGEIKVPITENLSFYYPLHRHLPIENGKKIIYFNSPFDILSGDRFHEFIGARYALKPKGIIGTDIHRIKRQQILLKEILQNKYNFNINYDEKYIMGINENIINNLKQIDETWNFIIPPFNFIRINNLPVIKLI